MSEMNTGFLALAQPQYVWAPPDPTIWTPQNFNVGAGVISQQFNNTFPNRSITLVQQDPNGTNNIIAIDKPKINPLFTITTCIQSNAFGNNQLVGLWYSDGGAGPNCGIAGWDAGIAFRIEIYSDFRTFVGDAFNVDTRPMCPNPLWIRMRETASQRSFWFSTDGINFVMFFTQAVNTNFVTQRYGFAIAPRDGASGPRNSVMGTLLSFSEGTPGV